MQARNASLPAPLSKPAPSLRLIARRQPPSWVSVSRARIFHEASERASGSSGPTPGSRAASPQIVSPSDSQAARSRSSTIRVRLAATRRQRASGA